MNGNVPLRLLFLGILLSLTLGCAEGHLYPVKGPYAAQSPLPVFTAKMGGGLHSGSLSVVLADGEKGTGRWEWHDKPPSSANSPTEGSSPESMASAWDAVYGQGFYVSHVLGNKLLARASVTGDRGTQLQMEIYRPENEGGDAPVNFRGVARDNKGNVYKVVF